MAAEIDKVADAPLYERRLRGTLPPFYLTAQSMFKLKPWQGFGRLRIAYVGPYEGAIAS